MSADLERRMADHVRRLEDQERRCDIVTDSITLMQADIKAMKEILEAWNSVKGFGTGMKFISASAKILLPILALGGAIWYLIMNGHLPPPTK